MRITLCRIRILTAQSITGHHILIIIAVRFLTAYLMGRIIRVIKKKIIIGILSRPLGISSCAQCVVLTLVHRDELLSTFGTRVSQITRLN